MYIKNIIKVIKKQMTECELLPITTAMVYIQKQMLYIF